MTRLRRKGKNQGGQTDGATGVINPVNIRPQTRHLLKREKQF